MKKVTIIIVSVILLVTNAFSQEGNITLSEFVKKLNTSAHPQILDARSPEEFTLNHLKGAININLKDSSYQKVLNTLHSSHPTFVYSINNGRSSALARQLRSKGFTEVYELPGGLANWVGSGNPLETVSKEGVTISKEAFIQLTKSDEIVLVDFGSKYCGGCRRLATVVDSLEAQKVSNLKIVRIEMYDNPELVKDLKIAVMPTLVLYRQGFEVWKNTGLIQLNALTSVIESKKLTAGISK